LGPILGKYPIDNTHSNVYNFTQKEGGFMATNLAIDLNLLDDALKAGGLKTKRETVNLALKEFIQRRQNAAVLSLFGKVEYESDYDYKDARRSKK
jgi:Arc/MetJ family transcription regulator